MKRRIRVAHLISPILFYGKEKWLLSFLKHCDKERFEYVVMPLVNAANASFCDLISTAGVACEPIGMYGRFSFDAHRKIRSFIKSRSIDIVHSHDYKSDFVALWLKKSTGVKVVGTPHGWSNEPDIKLQMYQLLDKFCLGFFDRVVPLSHHMTRSIMTLRKRRLMVIENFVDVSDLPEPARPEAKLFSYIGRLTRLKRVEDALEALRHTAADDVRIQVIGEGPFRSRLEKMAQDIGVAHRVHFCGFREDRLTLLGRSTALVLPSLAEGISRVAMEAMAIGKPVIGTDIPGISVLVKDGETGILVPERSPISIARAIDLLVDGPELAVQMGERGRSLIFERFSAPAAVERYERLYEGLVS